MMITIILDVIILIKKISSETVYVCACKYFPAQNGQIIQVGAQITF
jgi:hypothetical protein